MKIDLATKTLKAFDCIRDIVLTEKMAAVVVASIGTGGSLSEAMTC